MGNINRIDFYGKEILYSIRDEEVCWKIKGDIFKRYTDLRWFNLNILGKDNTVQSLTYMEVDKIKKVKVWNRDNQYIGIDKSNGRIVYYDKTRYKLAKSEGYVKAKVSFYLPHIDIETLLEVFDGSLFEVANVLLGSCNTEDIEMDIDTLVLILRKVKEDK
ncbi:MAG: hypothetical protein ACRDBY_05055 [Cetobacterium sp.]